MKLKICCANHKGGAGKTTTTMLLAGALASDTFRVAVIDLDSQGSACLWSETSGRFPAKVVPAKAATLPQVLESLKDYDLVLMDCPPSSTAPETLAAMAVATLALIPCMPSAPDFWATDALVNVVETRFPSLPKLVLVNQASHTALAKEMVGHIEQTWPTAKSRLGARTAYREAAAAGLSLRQLPGRANHDAIAELDALSLEILTTALKNAR